MEKINILLAVVKCDNASKQFSFLNFISVFFSFLEKLAFTATLSIRGPVNIKLIMLVPRPTGLYK